jgi:DNA primase
MALYTKESIERVKDAVDMVGLVGGRTDLRRVGARYTGLCPFHDERTPSFSVSAEHKLYHCFGCGASGDAIRFVQDTEGLEFKEAVEFLAERYGVELRREREDPRAEERRRRRERLLQLVGRATAYYGRYLWESDEARNARAYLLGRGLGEQVLRDFSVGYAPSAWDRLVLGAQRDGYRAEELLAAGLAQRGREGSLYDRFRARITFPVADPRGRVVGFGARATRETQRPKYLNTSENELYHKGRQLFGIDRARRPAAQVARMVVVEGYTDVLALHQAGIPETVGIMGTALTQEQLAELSRAASTVYLALDADLSGREAMLRAARGARDRGVELLVVDMPEGRDPADLVTAEGAEAFAARLEAAVSVAEFEVRRVLEEADLGSPRGRDDALERVTQPLAATPPNSATREQVVSYVADRLDVPDEYLVTRLAAAAARTRPVRVRPSEPAPTARAPETESRAVGEPSIDSIVAAERMFLVMCLAQPEVGREYLARLSDRHLSSDALRRARDWIATHFDDPLAGLPPDDPSLTAAVTEVVMRAAEEPSSELVLDLAFLQLELRRIERELRHAQGAEDFDRQRDLWGAREDVKRQISEVMGQAA